MKKFVLVLALLLLPFGSLAQISSSEESQYKKELCVFMAKISGISAEVMQKQPISKPKLKNFIEDVIVQNQLNSKQAGQARRAMEFGIYMASSYTPQEVAKFQYTGCMAAT